MVSVVIHEPPKRRRTGLLVAVGVLLVAALGVGGFLLLRSDDEEATYSLSAAAARAADTTSVAFTMTMNVMGEEIVADAATDSERGLTHITMDLGGAELGIDATMEMIADDNAKVVYLQSGFFEALGLDVDTDWIKMDEEFLASQGGADADMFGSASVGNPLDVAPLFEHAKSVTEVGFDDVDGVKVQHFEVVVDTLAALDASPQLQQQFEELSGDLPTDLTYDVYVDEQNQIRRLSTVVKAGATKVEIDIVIKPLTEPLVIEVPDPADVTDIADLM
jgi:hypothetical protein